MSFGIERYTQIAQLRERLTGLRRQGKRIGLVPTMGALHEGHLSLVRRIRSHCDCIVTSIFVNPLQFNNPEDYRAYVISLEGDERLLDKEGVHVLFAPNDAEIYPAGFQSTVTVQELSKGFEGEHRPGHFAGVATVVSMLFLIVQPDVSVFGEKDFQQLRLIEQLVMDLKFPIQIIRGELIRDADGVALSSRNSRLSVEGRRQAAAIYRGLQKASLSFARGEHMASKLEAEARNEIARSPDAAIEYLAVVDEERLERQEKVTGPSRMLTVVRIDGVRLLDNVPLCP